MTTLRVLFGVLALSSLAGAQEKQETKPPPLLRQIGIDFKNFFTTEENLRIGSVGAAMAAGASVFDQHIAESAFNSQNGNGSTTDEVFDAGTILGGSAVQVGGAVATYSLGKLFGSEGVEKLGRDLVRAQVVVQSLTFGIKVVAQRERPDGSDHYSFPSGHASGTFATATVLQRHYGWKVGVPAYAVAGYVAASRLSEGKHYLSDVIFGSVLGIMAGRTVTLELARARFALSPMLATGGAGIQLTWLGQGDAPRTR